MTPKHGTSILFCSYIPSIKIICAQSQKKWKHHQFSEFGYNDENNHGFSK